MSFSELWRPLPQTNYAERNAEIELTADAPAITLTRNAKEEGFARFGETITIAQFTYPSGHSQPIAIGFYGFQPNVMSRIRSPHPGHVAFAYSPALQGWDRFILEYPVNLELLGYSEDVGDHVLRSRQPIGQNSTGQPIYAFKAVYDYAYLAPKIPTSISLITAEVSRQPWGYVFLAIAEHVCAAFGYGTPVEGVGQSDVFIAESNDNFRSLRKNLAAAEFAQQLVLGMLLSLGVSVPALTPLQLFMQLPLLLAQARSHLQASQCDPGALNLDPATLPSVLIDRTLATVDINTPATTPFVEVTLPGPGGEPSSYKASSFSSDVLAALTTDREVISASDLGSISVQYLSGDYVDAFEVHNRISVNPDVDRDYQWVGAEKVNSGPLIGSWNEYTTYDSTIGMQVIANGPQAGAIVSTFFDGAQLEWPDSVPLTGSLYGRRMPVILPYYDIDEDGSFTPQFALGDDARVTSSTGANAWRPEQLSRIALVLPPLSGRLPGQAAPKPNSTDPFTGCVVSVEGNPHTIYLVGFSRTTGSISQSSFHAVGHSPLKVVASYSAAYAKAPDGNYWAINLIPAMCRRNAALSLAAITPSSESDVRAALVTNGVGAFGAVDWDVLRGLSPYPSGELPDPMKLTAFLASLLNPLAAKFGGATGSSVDTWLDTAASVLMESVLPLTSYVTLGAAADSDYQLCQLVRQAAQSDRLVYLSSFSDVITSIITSNSGSETRTSAVEQWAWFDSDGVPRSLDAGDIIPPTLLQEVNSLHPVVRSAIESSAFSQRGFDSLAVAKQSYPIALPGAGESCTLDELAVAIQAEDEEVTSRIVGTPPVLASANAALLELDNQIQDIQSCCIAEAIIDDVDDAFAQMQLNGADVSTKLLSTVDSLTAATLDDVNVQATGVQELVRSKLAGFKGWLVQITSATSEEVNASLANASLSELFYGVTGCAASATTATGSSDQVPLAATGFSSPPGCTYVSGWDVLGQAVSSAAGILAPIAGGVVAAVGKVAITSLRALSDWFISMSLDAGTSLPVIAVKRRALQTFAYPASIASQAYLPANVQRIANTIYQQLGPSGVFIGPSPTGYAMIVMSTSTPITLYELPRLQLTSAVKPKTNYEAAQVLAQSKIAAIESYNKLLDQANVPEEKIPRFPTPTLDDLLTPTKLSLNAAAKSVMSGSLAFGATAGVVTFGISRRIPILHGFNSLCIAGGTFAASTGRGIVDASALIYAERNGGDAWKRVAEKSDAVANSLFNARTLVSIWALGPSVAALTLRIVVEGCLKGYVSIDGLRLGGGSEVVRFVRVNGTVNFAWRFKTATELRSALIRNVTIGAVAVGAAVCYAGSCVLRRWRTDRAANLQAQQWSLDPNDPNYRENQFKIARKLNRLASSNGSAIGANGGILRGLLAASNGSASDPAGYASADELLALQARVG